MSKLIQNVFGGNGKTIQINPEIPIQINPETVLLETEFGNKVIYVE